jgi:hypothetical protein
VTSSESQGHARSKEDREGFALVTVLIAFALLSSTATAITIGTRNAARTANSELQALTARHLADAGLHRLIASIEDPSDPLVQEIRSTAQPVRWMFSGGTVMLSMVPESGKIDVNAGDRDLLRNALRIAIQDGQRAEEIFREVLQARERKQAYMSPLAILSAHEQLLPVASRIASTFTVMTRRRGINPGSAPEDVLRSFPTITEPQLTILRAVQRGDASIEATRQLGSYANLFEPELPIYTLIAAARSQNGTVVRRRATITIDQMSRQAFVVAWGDLFEPLGIEGDDP